MFSTNNLPAEYLGANLGFEPQEFEYMLEMGDKSKLKDLMKPLVSQFQQSSSQNVSINKQQTNSNSNASITEGGRPQKDVADMQDSGEKSREYKENRVGEE